MAIQLSPGVAVSEVDLTTVVPSVQTTAGAFAGYFPWGPVNKFILVDNEITLVNRFTAQGPDANSAVNFFTCANFLAYGNNLTVVRTVGANCFNAVAVANVAVQCGNSDAYLYSYLNSTTDTWGFAMAKYPGEIGRAHV